MSGTLYLIPVPLGDMPPQQVLPQPVIEQARQLTHFVVERAKSARAFLKAIAPLQPLQQLQLAELNEHTPQAALVALLAPCWPGRMWGCCQKPAVRRLPIRARNLSRWHRIRESAWCRWWGRRRS